MCWFDSYLIRVAGSREVFGVSVRPSRNSESSPKFGVSVEMAEFILCQQQQQSYYFTVQRDCYCN